MGAKQGNRYDSVILYNLHHNQRLTMEEIGIQFGVGKDVISEIFKNRNIPHRTHSEAQQLRFQNSKPHNWNGGVWRDKRGYIRIALPEGYTYEHIQVWEATNGPLPLGYVVHHKNGELSDNRIANLEAMSRAEHKRLHKPRLGTGRAQVGEG